MSKIDTQPVIMAGGSGTRLWPLSRAGYPKQFLVLNGNTSLFQQAADRLSSLGAEDIAVMPPIVVGNEEHRFMVLDQLRELKLAPSAVLLEPVSAGFSLSLSFAFFAMVLSSPRGFTMMSWMRRPGRARLCRSFLARPCAAATACSSDFA